MNDNLTKSWDIDIDALYDYAKENINKTVTVDNISDILGEMMHGTSIDKTRHIAKIDEPMAVISTVGRVNGSGAVVIIPDLIENGELADRDYIIIPSSIHECLLLSDTNGMGVDDINSMIVDVNSTQVSATDFLSNNAFIYKAATRSFETLRVA